MKYFEGIQLIVSCRRVVLAIIDRSFAITAVSNSYTNKSCGSHAIRRTRKVLLLFHYQCPCACAKAELFYSYSCAIPVVVYMRKFKLRIYKHVKYGRGPFGHEQCLLAKKILICIIGQKILWISTVCVEHNAKCARNFISSKRKTRKSSLATDHDPTNIKQ